MAAAVCSIVVIVVVIVIETLSMSRLSVAASAMLAFGEKSSTFDEMDGIEEL